MLRMIIPARAISPSSATNPNGLPERLSASEAPMMPSGAVRKTRISREKLRSWIISRVSIAPAMSGKSAKSSCCLSAIPPRRPRSRGDSRERACRGRLEGRPDLARHIRRLDAVHHVGAHGDRHISVAPPQDRLLVRVLDAPHLRKRNGDAVAGDDRQVADPAEIEPLRPHRSVSSRFSPRPGP